MTSRNRPHERQYWPWILVALGGLHAVVFYGSTIWAADHPFWLTPAGDIAVGLIGVHGFVNDTWRWPAGTTALLQSSGQPISIGFTDSLPILALILKALQLNAVPTFGAAILLASLLQPVSAGWALKRAGVGNPLVLILGALLVACAPLWYFRLSAAHISLTWQWELLLALGLALGWCRSKSVSTRDFVLSCLLIAIAVATHVYLAVMVFAVCMTGTLVLVASKQFVRATAFTCFLILPVVIMAAVIGLIPTSVGQLSIGPHHPPAGFYGLNLLAPFDIAYSALIASSKRPFDGTGGQYEGMAFLGVGVTALLLFVLAVMSIASFRKGSPYSARLVAYWLWPLSVPLLGLAAFAALPDLWFGQTRLLTLPVPSSLGLIFDQFRAGGRMIWPLIYGLSLVAVVIAAQLTGPTRTAIGLASVLLLQVLDTSSLRSRFPQMSAATIQPPEELKALRAGKFLDGDIRLRPAWPCIPEIDRDIARLAALEVSRAGRIVHEPPLARGRFLSCKASAILEEVAPPGAVDLIFRSSLSLADQIAIYRQRDCFLLGSLLVCKGQRVGRKPTADEAFSLLVPASTFGLNESLPAKQGGIASRWLYSGWSQPEPWGTWTEGKEATLLLPLPATGRVQALVLAVTAYASASEGGQNITITIADEHWSGRVPIGKTTLVRIPVKNAAPLSVMHVTIDVGRPSSPTANGQVIDPRLLGLGLISITFEGEG